MSPKDKQKSHRGIKKSRSKINSIFFNHQPQEKNFEKRNLTVNHHKICRIIIKSMFMSVCAYLSTRSNVNDRRHLFYLGIDFLVLFYRVAEYL